jgi:hypothetical protein
MRSKLASSDSGSDEIARSEPRFSIASVSERNFVSPAGSAVD